MVAVKGAAKKKVGKKKKEPGTNSSASKAPPARTQAPTGDGIDWSAINLFLAMFFLLGAVVSGFNQVTMVANIFPGNLISDAYCNNNNCHCPPPPSGGQFSSCQVGLAAGVNTSPAKDQSLTFYFCYNMLHVRKYPV